MSCETIDTLGHEIIRYLGDAKVNFGKQFKFWDYKSPVHKIDPEYSATPFCLTPLQSRNISNNYSCHDGYSSKKHMCRLSGKCGSWYDNSILSAGYGAFDCTCTKLYTLQ